MTRTTTSLAAIAAIAALGLAACSSGAAPSSQPSAASGDTASATQPSSVTIDANDGMVEINLPVTRAASLDNRTFEVLQQWDVELVAAPKKLVDDFNASIERAKNAYDGTSTVMAVDVSGGNIGYVAPGKGRTWGPVFDLLDLKPALEIEGATDSHTGDDISVEAIAESNPAWMLVLDRDAAITKDGSNTPAETVISGNAVLQNVTAISTGQVVYAPNDTYTNESIITYTEIFNSLADAFEAAKK